MPRARFKHSYLITPRFLLQPANEPNLNRMSHLAYSHQDQTNITEGDCYMSAAQ